MVCLSVVVAVPGAIVAYRLTGPSSVLVDPTPAPAPVTGVVRELVADFTPEEKQFLVDHYRALLAVADMGVIRDTEQLRDSIELARMAVYGKANPLGAKADPLNAVLVAEAVNRGMLAPDLDEDGRPDAVSPFTPELWKQACREVLAGLEVQQ